MQIVDFKVKIDYLKLVIKDIENSAFGEMEGQNSVMRGKKNLLSGNISKRGC